jgi:Protein of unknown function (DUF1559)
MKITILNRMFWPAAMMVMLAVGQHRAAAAESPPIDHAAVLAPLVNSDTFAVAYANVGSLDMSGANGQLLMFLPSIHGGDGGADVVVITVLAGAVKTLQNSGVESVYVVAGLADLYVNGGPVVVLSLKSGSDTKAVAAMLQGVSQTLAMAGGKEWLPDKIAVHPHGTNTILVGAESVVARYEKLTMSSRDDLSGTIEKLAAGGAEAAVVFSPGPDFRRVIRELWPTLPEPMTPLRGELADKWLRLELSAKSRPSASGQVALLATDAASAQVFVDLWRALPECDRFEDGPAHRQRLSQVLQTIVDALPPQLDGNRVVMRFPTDPSQLDKLRGLVSETANKALEKSRHSERLNRFKQLGISMYNYESQNKHFPPPAICDKQGKPLLSWRVAILPFLDEKALFERFHLDEPWDSPHNLELVKQMPSIYSDPTPTIRAAAGDGKTTFVVPVGPGTAFDTKEGIALREIKDGTSNTALIVEVVPERAVEWTKPADWDVDMDYPLAGVARTDRHQFAAAYCDGSVRLLPVDIKPEIFRAILTRAGGEQIDSQY